MKKLKDLTSLDFPITDGDWEHEIHLWKIEGHSPSIAWERWLKLRDIGMASWKAHQNALSRAHKPRQRVLMYKGSLCSTNDANS